MNTRRWFVLLLAAVMLLSIVNIGVFAEDVENPEFNAFTDESAFIQGEEQQIEDIGSDFSDFSEEDGEAVPSSEEGDAEEASSEGTVEEASSSEDLEETAEPSEDSEEPASSEESDNAWSQSS